MVKLSFYCDTCLFSSSIKLILFYLMVMHHIYVSRKQIYFFIAISFQIEFRQNLMEYQYPYQPLHQSTYLEQSFIPLLQTTFLGSFTAIIERFYQYYFYHFDDVMISNKIYTIVYNFQEFVIIFPSKSYLIHQSNTPNSQKKNNFISFVIAETPLIPY